MSLKVSAARPMAMLRPARFLSSPSIARVLDSVSRMTTAPYHGVQYARGCQQQAADWYDEPVLERARNDQLATLAKYRPTISAATRPFGSGEHRGSFVHVVGSVNLGAGVDQQLCELWETIHACTHERRFPSRRRMVGIGTCVQEGSSFISMAKYRSSPQCRVTVAVGWVDLSTSAQQQS